ncbi:MAG: exodeoxyribonuclease VII small subunit [Erysipelotrichaceae bacterium]
MDKNFNESLQELEAIVTKLQNNELSLDVAIEEYSKGLKLIKEASDTLKAYEEKIKELNTNA